MTMKLRPRTRRVGVRIRYKFTPTEIRTIRERHGLTQQAFASLTGLGLATVWRWEKGMYTQNKSLDRFLYLLTFPENMERLKHRRNE